MEITLEKKIEELQVELGKRLAFLRVAKTGVQSEFKMAKVMGMGESTLYKLENGLSLPTRRTLLDIKQNYELTELEYEDLQLRAKKIRSLRKEAK